MNIDSLDELLDLIQSAKKASIMYGAGGLIDAETKTPLITFELDEKQVCFVKIGDKWWHRR